MAVAQKQCSKCGEIKDAKAFGKNRRECRSCVKRRQQKWEADNRKHVNQLHRDWKEQNPERSEAIKKRWYLGNRTAVLVKRKAGYDLDPDPKRAYARKYNAKYPEAARIRLRQWVKDNPLRAKTHWMNRRARAKNLPNTWTVQQASAALEHFGHACAVCRVPIGLLAELHWDHWLPIVHPTCPGTVASNMTPLCGDCNRRKNRSLPDPWLQRMFPTTWEQIKHRVESYLKGIVYV